MVVWVDTKELCLADPGGVDRLILHLLRGLEENGEKVRFFSDDREVSWAELTGVPKPLPGVYRPLQTLYWRLRGLFPSHLFEAGYIVRLKNYLKERSKRGTSPNESSSQETGEEGSILSEMVAEDLVLFSSPYIIDEGVGRRFATVRAKKAFILHDLLPLTEAEYGEDLRRKLEKVLPLALDFSDFIVFNSQFTRKSFQDYCVKHCYPQLRSVVLPLGGQKIMSGKRRFTHRDRVMLLQLPRRYILYVATITARKNHKLVCQLLRDLRSEQSEDHPVSIVLAGHLGRWPEQRRAQDMLEEIHALQKSGKDLLFFESPSDLALESMYLGAFFTIFPSRAEGFGFPVAESLAYGKFCLSSETTSLREAGLDFVEYLPPDDIELWKRRILHYYQNPEDVAARERQIRHYSPPTCQQAAHALLQPLTHSEGED